MRERRRLENIHQTERDQRADYLADFLNRINAKEILGSAETKRDFIKNLSFDDFKAWVVRINGILRSIPIKERGLDGKDVALMPNLDQVNEIGEALFIGAKKSEYPPREADKEELLREMFKLAQKMEAQGSGLNDIALLLSTGINAIHPFEDGNGRVSRLINYLINADYTGSKEQVDFLKKLLGDGGRLLININPGEARDAITEHIRYHQLGISYQDKSLPHYLGHVSLAEAGEKIKEKAEEEVPFKVLQDFQRYILGEGDDFGFFAIYSFLQKKGTLSDFLSLRKDSGGAVRGTDLRVANLIEKLEPEEFSEILEEYWQIKKGGVSLLLRALAEPEEFKIERSQFKGSQGKTIKECFLASLDQSYLQSSKEVNMEDIDEIWAEKDELPFTVDKLSSEEMLQLAEINEKLREFKDQEKNERAALSFDFEKADQEFGLEKQKVEAMRMKENPEGSEEESEHKRLLKIAQKRLYEAKRRIYQPVLDLENKYLERVIRFLDGLDIWQVKFTTRDENCFASKEEKEDTDSIYYVSKTGQSLRIKKHGLLKDGLSGSIEPFMEKIFYIDSQRESFRNRANVSDQAQKGLFVMEYTTDEFLEVQNGFTAQDFTSRIRRFEKDGKIIYLNPVDGRRHRGYPINKFL